MRRLLAIGLFAVLLGAAPVAVWARGENPVAALVERIQPGQSSRFIFELADQQSPEDFFELDSRAGKVVVRGNNYLSVAVGLNWYLKYYAGVHITWNNPHPRLSNIRFPKPKQVERHQTDLLVRYYMNYCTFSYSTAFWETVGTGDRLDGAARGEPATVADRERHGVAQYPAGVRIQC